jgi:DNA-binding Lrp family transcriptional regulator
MEDGLTRLILAALYLNGRAGWRTIARAVGAGEAAVARVGQRLLGTEVARVVGLLDPLQVGTGIPVLLRVRCAPGRLREAAGALSALPESFFVTLVSGGTDCVAQFNVADKAALRRLLIDAVPQVGGVLSADTHLVLRTFRRGAEWDPGLVSPAGAALLRPWGPAPADGGPPANGGVTEVDVAIAQALHQNGRKPFAEVAAEVGRSESTVARRVEALVARRALHFRTLLDLARFGFDHVGLLWIQAAPGAVEPVVERLAADRRVMYLVATGGAHQVVAEVALRRHDESYDVGRDVLAGLEGVQAMDVTLELETLKRAGVALGDHVTW